MPDANIKQTFIEALRLTPEGITSFLATPFPTPPSIAAPSDEASAIIANGICSKFVLDLFAPFAGFTPVEALLRIGQHNSVLEAGLLAGLEYIGDSEAQQNFEVLEPQAGVSYSPGEMRFIARAVNGTISSMTLSLGGNTTIDMREVEGEWRQLVNMNDVGDFTATFAADFEGGTTPQTLTVNFSIAEYDENAPPEEQPEPPGGKDNPALDAVLAKLKAAAQRILTKMNATLHADAADVATMQGAFTDLCNVALHLGGNAAIITQARTDFSATVTALQEAIQFARLTDVELFTADLLNLAETVYGTVP